MKFDPKTHLALVFLVLLMAVPSVYLSRGNKELEERLETMKGAGVGEAGRLRGYSRKNREMTVGRLFRQSSRVTDARSMVMTYAQAQQDRNSFAMHKLQYDLAKLTFEELRALRVGIRKIPGPHKETMELMISSAELSLSPDEPGLFLDAAIQTARFDRNFQKKLEDWALSDPGAAIAWFQSQTAANHFENGTIDGRDNRAKAFGSLIKGIAAGNLELAVDLFSKESRLYELLEARSILVSLSMERAIEEKDESLFRTVLETSDFGQMDPFSLFGSGGPWFDYTKATGDLTRSVNLLKSMNNQAHFGRKMAAIIASQEDMPLREQIDWLKNEIPDQQGQIEAFEASFSNRILNDPFATGLEFVDSVKELERGLDRDLELSALVKGLRRTGRREEATALIQEIEDPGLRAKAEKDQADDPFRVDEGSTR